MQWHHSTFAMKKWIFMPNVSYFCAFCVLVGYNPISGFESPEHGDDPPYPNLEKISSISRSS